MLLPQQSLGCSAFGGVGLSSRDSSQGVDHGRQRREAIPQLRRFPVAEQQSREDAEQAGGDVRQGA